MRFEKGRSSMHNPDRRWTDSEDGAQMARYVATSLWGVLGDIHRNRFVQARRALGFALMSVEAYGVPRFLADPTLEIARRVQSQLGGRNPHAAKTELEALIDFWGTRARLQD
jgi:hypothetical protein